MSTNLEAQIKDFNSQIASAPDAEAIIPSLIDEINGILLSEKLNLYSVDRLNKQLYSRNVIADTLKEIRVDISKNSLMGHVASTGKGLLLANANSPEELNAISPELQGGSSLDGNIDFKTQSLIVMPLPYQKKLIGVAEVINKKNNGSFTDDDFKSVKDLSFTMGRLLAKLDESNGANMTNTSQERLLSIANEIHSAKNVDEILLELKFSIPEVFDASLITIYAVDTIRNEIYSKMKSGDTINEIRVPISPKSIAGFVAGHQTLVNIQNVYDDKELMAFHPHLKFDRSWDRQSGFRTKSMLVVPMSHNSKLMGVLQLINKIKGGTFNDADEKNSKYIADTLALAFFNQSKFVQPKPTKFSYLLSNGIISDSELTSAISKARRSQVDIETILLNDLGVTRKELGKSMEIFYKLPYLGYDDSVVIPASVMDGLNRNFMTKNNWVPVSKDQNKVVILIDNPMNQDRIHSIKQIFPKKNLEFRVSLKADIQNFLNASVSGDIESDEKPEMPSAESVFDFGNDPDNVEVVDEEEDIDAISEGDNITVRMVNKILLEAYDTGVSDIHIEPGTGKDPLIVRYRTDGACRVYQNIPYIYKQAVIARIKILSKLDIAEKRMPQDGKIKMKYGKKEIEFRVATCPTVGGNEDAVLRILAASKPIPLDKMNFSDRNLHLLQETAKSPYGLILCVGPTGSGKTTTLHSALGSINKPDIKIWTAEDPVEITQKGLRQVQMLNKIGLDFARAMRSFLRGDPDVIMVGEMRDAETCGIGLEASLTGHLVFSTLHTNSAPETITRLLDMGMNPLNFADALLLILAQRLVRTLCKKCKSSYHPDQEEFDTLVREYGEGFDKLGIEYNDDLVLMGPAGCSACNDTGYAGRTGLHELLEGTDTMKRMIMQKTLVEELRKQAISDGMTTLKQDGIRKVFKGDCDLKQVLAVCIV
jgi:type II secretory ATPase GspE/PulE/Tfp pilus assembly ATPase PilB-like protein/GAF domain-containing protein